MPWGIWIIAGLALLALELFVPSGFFMFVIGVSAIVTGALAWVGVANVESTQWLICAVLAIILVMFVRRRLIGRFAITGSTPIDSQAGKEVLIKEDIPPGGIGQGEMRGAGWSVRNTGKRPLRAGERCLIAGCEGITLIVQGQ